MPDNYGYDYGNNDDLDPPGTEHRWCCLYCKDELPNGTPCMKPECVEARRRSRVRMGLED